MTTKFEMSDLGMLTYYLGIKVHQLAQGIVLTQDRYARKVREEASMHACNLAHVPMEFNVKLSKAPQEASINLESEFVYINFAGSSGCSSSSSYRRP